MTKSDFRGLPQSILEKVTLRVEKLHLELLLGLLWGRGHLLVTFELLYFLGVSGLLGGQQRHNPAVLKELRRCKFTMLSKFTVAQ